jgi:glycosyltransferase involved in cell wall biosynthesis
MPTSLPVVSIIIPCYNAAQYVGEAIESALAQTYSFKEVIVIDDGSTDHSLDVIRSYGDRIRWETGANRGGCAARNRGLELARGEFVQLLDADDLLLPKKLERQMLFYEKNECELVTCDHFELADNTQRRVINCDPLVRSTPRWMIQDERLGVSAPLHVARSVRAIDGFDEDLPCSQEYDLHLRMVLRGMRVRHLKEALWVVRSRPDSLSSDILKVTRQHVRIFTRVFKIACRSLQGYDLDEAKEALAEACIRDLRRCLQNGESDLASEFLCLAAQFHSSRGLGFYRYNRIAYAIAKIWGPNVVEKIVALRRSRTGYYRKRLVGLPQLN